LIYFWFYYLAPPQGELPKPYLEYLLIHVGYFTWLIFGIILVCTHDESSTQELDFVTTSLILANCLLSVSDFILFFIVLVFDVIRQNIPKIHIRFE
jgi:uncharacterized protein with PQ loop repeat